MSATHSKGRRSASIAAGTAALALAALALAEPAAANTGTADPFGTSAGVFKLGNQSVGVPYRLPDGRTGAVTARHGVGTDPWTDWNVWDAAGNRSTGRVIASSNADVDVALVAPSTGSWASLPPVFLSDDYSARFQARAKSVADVQPGDRICKTGWSPLSRNGAGHRLPNATAPADIPSAGNGVICGRVQGLSGLDIWIGSSDRPDGFIVGGGDSGAAVWKVTEDGAFMYIGMVKAMSHVAVAGDGNSYGKLGLVSPAWLLESRLDATPMLTNQRPFLTVSPSTYFPTPQGTVELRGSFRDANGDPIADKHVDVLQNYAGNVVASTRTDANGNYAVKVGTPTRGASFAVRFPGDAGMSAVASRFISVSSTVATVVNPPSTADAGGQTTLRARATSASGVPMVGRTVRVQLYTNAGSNDFTIPVTGTTDDDGYVDLTFPTPSADARYAVRLMDDPSSNGNPVGAAASAIYSLTVK
jgi:hypothetical protein